MHIRTTLAIAAAALATLAGPGGSAQRRQAPRAAQAPQNATIVVYKSPT